MCDDAKRIMMIVHAVKRVEVFLGRELTYPQYQVIMMAERENTPFEIEGRIFEF